MAKTPDAHPARQDARLQPDKTTPTRALSRTPLAMPVVPRRACRGVAPSLFGAVRAMRQGPNAHTVEDVNWLMVARR